MGDSSVYELQEDDESSRSEVQDDNLRSIADRSDLTRRSSEAAGSAEYNNITSRASLGTRSSLLEDLRVKLPKESVNLYTQLLERAASELSSATVGAEGRSHIGSQNGAVIWTGKEKELFFHLLDRKGRDEIKTIADGIGSKSELEVLDYLKLLHKGLMNQHLNEGHSRAVVLGEIPPAAEISVECCQALDEYAELLNLEEQQTVLAAQKRKHKNLWIIDQLCAEEVDDRLEDIEDVTAEVPSIYFTASLLNIRKWIQISERVFMNFGGSKLQDNWVNVALEDEFPSLTAEAFSDFYALTVSITRRLVHSALFFAESRMRASRSRAQVVKSRDVKSAVDVLNMKRDSWEFWAEVPRRCHLDIADFRHVRGWRTEEYMHINEVEDTLSSRAPLAAGSSSGAQTTLSSQSHADEIPHDLEPDNENDSDFSDTTSSSVRSEASSSPLDRSDEAFVPDLEEEHAETMDFQTSSTEEARLWNMMNRPMITGSGCARSLKDDSGMSKPSGHRKSKAELADWRDKVLHRSEWEEYGHRIFEIAESIAEDRRKRRRIQT